MEFDELFVPPDLGDDYAAGVLTRLFGGIIPRLHGEGNATIVASNWLETIFTVFNTFCLLAMLVVLSYTIYAMVFDTAADGQTFGQSGNTRYTVLRTLVGVIGFVPVVGGFSLAQVAFLWLLLQGSALADVTWRNVADDMLAGTPLVSNTIDRLPEASETLLRDFGAAYDALVTGHLCGMNANRIAAVIGGDTDVTVDDVSTAEDGAGVIRATTSAPQMENTTGWLGAVWNPDQRSMMMSHSVRFEEREGAAYGGRDNYCGGVNATDFYTAHRVEEGDLAGEEFNIGLMAVRAQGQFKHLADEVLLNLSEDARAVAGMIYAGERDAETLLGPSREAVYDAVESYLSGPATSTQIASNEVLYIHDELLGMVTEEGWMLAPVWQRGVAQTVMSIEMPGATLTLESVRDNRIADFLSGDGYRVDRDDAAVGDMLVKADADQDTWDELAAAVVTLPPPDRAPPRVERMGSVGLENYASINAIYHAILGVFSPVATDLESGNFGFVDPMLQVQKQGSVLSAGGALSLGGGIGVEYLLGTTEVGSMISGALVSLGVTLVIVGFVMMIVVPLVPTIYFYATVMSWLLQAVEAMFAIPLVVLQFFTPAREPTLVGSFSRVLLAAFAVFMRPFFMIVGLILAMMVISVSLTYLHEVFSRLMFFVGGGGLAEAVGLNAVMRLVFFLAIYVLLAFLTVLYGSQIISEFGDFAMNAIGAAAGRYTQPSNIADKAVLAGGLGYAGARSAGQLPGALRTAQLQERRRQLPGPSVTEPR